MEEIQRQGGELFFTRHYLPQMTRTILACRYSGSFSIHQLEGGALPSIKPCYQNGSNDSAGLIVKSLSGLHIRSKAEKTEGLTHTEGSFVQHEWERSTQHMACFPDWRQSVHYRVLPPLFPLRHKCQGPPSCFMWPARASKAAVSNSFSPRATSALQLLS